MTIARDCLPQTGAAPAAPRHDRPARAPARHFGAAIALASAVIATSAFAQSTTAPGLRVVKDPVTGALRAPTAEEFRAMKAAEAGSGKGAANAAHGILSGKANPQPATRGDGSVEVELTNDTQSYSVARRNASGGVDAYCVTGVQAATDVLKGKKVASARKIDKEGHHDHQK